jgi:hypothetical protein
MIVGAEHATDASGEVVGVERFLERRTWGGDRVWRVDLPAHHDVAPTPDGRWSVLTRRLRRLPAISSEVPVQDDGVAIVSEDGRVIEERSLHDLLTSGATPFQFKRLEPRKMKAAFSDLLDPAHAPESLEKGFVDLIHANSLQWIDLPGRSSRTRIAGPSARHDAESGHRRGVRLGCPGADLVLGERRAHPAAQREPPPERQLPDLRQSPGPGLVKGHRARSPLEEGGMGVPRSGSEGLLLGDPGSRTEARERQHADRGFGLRPGLRGHPRR